MLLLGGRRQRGVLLPQRKAEWASSQNVKVETSFVLRARAQDGYCVWAGQFADRDDADAFLLAMALGSLQIESELWRLPVPNWHPDLYDLPLVYYFTTNVIINTGTTTWTVPSDWGSAVNTMRAIGGGGSNGGGGGAYSDISNQAYTAGTNITVQVGAGGPAGSTTDGTDTTARSNPNVSVVLLAKGGTRGPGGAGGASGSGTGTNRLSGGAAGAAGASAGGGGGGAGGSHGVGQIGGTGGGVASAPNGGGGGGGSDLGSAGSAGTGGGGGNGGNGNGGSGGGTGSGSGAGGNATANSGGGGGGGGAAVGGAVPGGTGANSTLFDATHGPGGGGGGGGGDDGFVSPGGDGGAGGASGGGGGSPGSGTSGGSPGAGGNGLLFFSYTPSGGLFRVNPMQGIGGGGPFFADPMQAKNRKH